MLFSARKRTGRLKQACFTFERPNTTSAQKYTFFFLQIWLDSTLCSMLRVRAIVTTSSGFTTHLTPSIKRCTWQMLDLHNKLHYHNYGNIEKIEYQ